MAGDAEQEVGPRQPHGKPKAQVTTIRKALIIGAFVALLVGAVSSLATARLTDRQSDLDEQRAQITQLASRVSQQEAQIAELTSQAGEGAGQVDRLNAEIAALNGQVLALEAEKASLEEQLSQILNPAPGPTPTAALTVNWVQPDCGTATDNNGVVTYQDCRQNIVCVTIENTSESAIDIYYSYSQFSGIDGDNFVYPPRLPTPGYGIRLATPLTSGQLGPGEKGRGELLYDVQDQAPHAVVPSLFTRLVWNTGFGEAPEVVVDLPAPQGMYGFTSQC